MKDYYVWINGDFIHPEQAPASLFTHGDEQAVSVVRVFRVYNTDSGPAIFRLTEHVRQFLEMVRAQGYGIHLTEDQLSETVHRTLLFNQMCEGFIRVSLRVKKNWDPDGDYRSRDENAFILAILSEDLAASWAVESEGMVLEKDVPTYASLFLVRNETITTPPSRIFGNSLVRNSVITLAEDLGYKVLEEPLTREQIVAADEVFLSTAVGEVHYVSEFNTQPIGNRSIGPITRSLQNAFYTTMQGRGERSREWLEWVGATFLGL